MRQVAAVLLAMMFGSQFNCIPEEEDEQCPPDGRYASNVAERAKAARAVLDVLDIDDDCAAEIKEWIVAEPEPIIRHDLFAALVDRGEDSDTEWLLSFLEDADPTLRAQAAAFATDEMTPCLEARLARQLGVEPYWWVRWMIVSALTEAEGEDAVDALHEAISDETRDVRDAAADALGYFCDERSLDPLMKAAHEWPVEASGMILDALGCIGDPAALPVLERGLDATRPSVRKTAVSALARLKSRESEQLLTKLLLDSDQELADSAARGLIAGQAAEAVAPLRSFTAVHPSRGLVEGVAQLSGRDPVAECDAILRLAESGSGPEQILTEVCEALQSPESEATVTFTSACHLDFLAIDESLYAPQTRLIAPSGDAPARAWRDFPGEDVGGEGVCLGEGLLVTIEEAILRGGETWLLINDDSPAAQYWIREADTRRISQEEWDAAIELLRDAKRR